MVLCCPYLPNCFPDSFCILFYLSVVLHNENYFFFLEVFSHFPNIKVLLTLVFLTVISLFLLTIVVFLLIFPVDLPFIFFCFHPLQEHILFWLAQKIVSFFRVFVLDFIQVLPHEEKLLVCRTCFDRKVYMPLLSSCSFEFIYFSSYPFPLIYPILFVHVQVFIVNLSVYSIVWSQLISFYAIPRTLLTSLNIFLQVFDRVIYVLITTWVFVVTLWHFLAVYQFFI